MIKRIAFFVLFLGAAWGMSVSNSYADKEFVQKVQGKVEGTVKEMTAIRDELNEMEREIRSTAEGIAGPIKGAFQAGMSAANDVKNTANSVKGAVDSAKQQAGAIAGGDVATAEDLLNGSLNLPTISLPKPQLPKAIVSVKMEDNEKLSQAIVSNYMAERGAGNSTAVVEQQNARMQVINRENFANLYSAAFTIRTNLAKERQTEKKNVLEECSKGNGGDNSTRCIKLAVRDKMDAVTRRMGRVLALELALYDFNITSQVGIYQSNRAEEE